VSYFETIFVPLQNKIMIKSFWRKENTHKLATTAKLSTSYKTKESPYIFIERRETPTNNLQIKIYRFGLKYYLYLWRIDYNQNLSSYFLKRMSTKTCKQILNLAQCAVGLIVHPSPTKFNLSQLSPT
jgi:hypothetical protein